MRARLVTFAVLGLASLTVGGCAGSAPVPVVPQPTLAALVEAPVAPADPSAGATSDLPDHDMAPPPEPVKHHVEILVDHLPAPKAFAPGATTYVFWVRANDDDAWANAAHLEPSKTAEEANFEFPQDTLLVHVTAEASADVRSPSEKVVLSTRVSTNGACAHSVDENDVKMKVRMCH